MTSFKKGKKQMHGVVLGRWVCEKIFCSVVVCCGFAFRLSITGFPGGVMFGCSSVAVFF